MARPKYDENAISSTERIENAYWFLLAREPYSTITVRTLAKEAGVNHNLIYYYYENIDDLAKKAFYNALSEEAFSMMLEGIRSGKVPVEIFTENAALMSRFNRVQLYLRGDSAYLTSIFRYAIRTTWLKQLNRKDEDLSEEDRIDLNFIIEGLMSAISSVGSETSIETVMRIVSRELGQGIIRTLERIGS